MIYIYPLILALLVSLIATGLRDGFHDESEYPTLLAIFLLVCNFYIVARVAMATYDPMWIVLSAVVGLSYVALTDE